MSEFGSMFFFCMALLFEHSIFTQRQYSTNVNAYTLTDYNFTSNHNGTRSNMKIRE